jgi:hypothetical protein
MAIDGLDRLIAMLQGLPIGVHGGAVLALLAGVALWLFGAKVLKPAFAILGMCTGSLAGAIALPLMGITQVGSIPSVYIGLGVGAIGGIIAACFLFRFALGIASALVFAAVGLLGASIYLNNRTPGTIDPPARLLLAPLGGQPVPDGESTDASGFRPDSTIVTRDADGSTTTFPPSADEATGAAIRQATGISEETQARLKDHAARARTFADEMSQRGRAAWGSVGTEDRLILTGGSLAGAVLGVLFGLTMPRRSAAMVTSLFGASIVLASSVWLAGAADAPGKQMLELQPGGIGIALGIATIIGMVVQLTMTSRRSGAAPSAEGD